MRDLGPNPFNVWLGPLTRAVALACGYILLLLAIVLSIEIVARKLFLVSFQGVDDLGGYVLAFATSIGISYALVTRSHTRVDILLSRLPAAMRRFFHAFAMLCMGCLALFAAWRCTNVLLESIEFGSLATNPLQTPLWQPQTIWIIGMYLFALTAVVYALHSLWLLASGREGLNTWYGLPGEAETDAPPAQNQNQTGTETGGSHE